MPTKTQKKLDPHVSALVDELLMAKPGISARGMFGGWGIYLDGVVFAIVAEGQLYFKVDADSKADYQARGSKPFMYTGHNGKPYEMSYWELPVEVLVDKTELADWIDTAVQVSKAGKKK